MAEGREWHYIVDGRQAGPVAEEALAALAGEGTITADTYVWAEGCQDWIRYGQMNDEEASRGTQGQAGRICTICERSFPPEQTIEIFGTYVCAECKPSYVQRMREGVDHPNAMRYAGFWIRFGARFVDGMLLALVNGAIILSLYMLGLNGETIGGALALQAVLMVGQHVVGATYTTYFVGRFGATPGKMLFGLRIVRDDGSALTYWRAFGRYWADRLSNLTLYVGYIMAAFDAEKRALHDHICSTRVICPSKEAPRKTSGILSCARCGAVLPEAVVNAPRNMICPACETLVRVHVFPALFTRPDSAPNDLPVLVEGESSCFYHEARKAEVVCESCGRFLCSLCDIDVREKHQCPVCIEKGMEKKALTELETQCTRYDSIALALAVLPPLLQVFLWCLPFTLVTAPAAVFMGFYYWKRPVGVLSRSKWRYVVAIVLGSMETVVLLMIIAFVAANIVQEFS